MLALQVLFVMLQQLPSSSCVYCLDATAVGCPNGAPLGVAGLADLCSKCSKLRECADKPPLLLLLLQGLGVLGLKLGLCWWQLCHVASTNGLLCCT